ncbi:MAG: HmuY family protein [Bacteroidetes bacterium]|nr:HmuY family protein [Bacteroidota bacterium]
MKKLFTQTILASLVTFTLMACSKTSDTTVVNNTPVTATVKDLVADTVLGVDPKTGPYSAGKYTFYSIENNSIVPNTDSATTKWDLAFMSTRILTNGGTSGTGKGGAFIYKGLFEDIKTIAADSVFKTDNAPSAYAITTGSGKGWYNYDQLTSLITPIAGRVLVIKTASGKYAKLEILSYYKGGVTLSPTASDADKLTKQRYYTFRFTYQPNGTTTF